jgi:hypothetical protein
MIYTDGLGAREVIGPNLQHSDRNAGTPQFDPPETASDRHASIDGHRDHAVPSQ